MATEAQEIQETVEKLVEQPDTNSKDERVFNTEEYNKEMDENEMKVLVELFKAYDTEKSGKIKANNLYEVASMLGKENQNVDEVLKRSNKTTDDLITLDEYKQIISELDRPNVSVVESERQSEASQRVLITPDPKVIEFLKLLYAFQAKCEKEGKYGEAKLAQEKMDEIKIKEILRQESNIRSFQEEELAQVENAQKEQFIEFNKVWDNYMAEYETTALASLEKMKEKHISEVAELHEKLKRELAFHFKSSKQLIELRQKEGALVKLKKYSEAEKIKAQADSLEEWERANKEKEIEEITDKKTLALRKQQQRSLGVLLKRIQKDRDQQLKNRDTDSQKLVLKNRNLRNELITKHANETKNALEIVRNNLSILNCIHADKKSALDRTSVKSNAKTDALNKSENEDH